MPKVSVLATGGTIASRRRADGSSAAAASAEELIASLPPLPDVEVVVEDVFRIGSYRMTLERMAQLAARTREHLAAGAAGVVVTHGTDTIEETALFLDLFVDGGQPVVLTGAQRAADAPDSDGPRNLAEAIHVAVDPESTGRGVMVVFDGTVFPARGIRKAHTLASTAFRAPDGGTLGWVPGGRVQLGAREAPVPRSIFGRSIRRAPGSTSSPAIPVADATALRAFADRRCARSRAPRDRAGQRQPRRSALRSPTSARPVSSSSPRPGSRQARSQPSTATAAASTCSPPAPSPPGCCVPPRPGSAWRLCSACTAMPRQYARSFPHC